MRRSTEAANLTECEGLCSTVRCPDLFANLPPEIVQAFEALQLRTSYPPATTLFVEDQLASGIFVLHSGRVRLVELLGKGERSTATIVGPGEILGIPASLAARQYRSIAQTVEPSEIGFIDCKGFSSFLCAHGEVTFRLVQLLSAVLTLTLDRARRALTRFPYPSNQLY